VFIADRAPEGNSPFAKAARQNAPFVPTGLAQRREPAASVVEANGVGAGTKQEWHNP